jgi:Flp pilus assembly pilin Flp
MKKKLRKLKKGRKGQGMTEYIIIVALIAIAAIGVVSLFGDNIRALFATSGNALYGEEKAEAMTYKADPKDYQHRGMRNFAEANKPVGASS